ncbi:SGNH/GDSL hydrolase family protein [Winogradskyella forsetii]|uniref:SGNH/GDSL hydrolase family protein n=1 Tax=Winogradskyella forsetii TaxID=2686077 RepID=UPI0015BB164E|nr:SGNH/GDSL hydrolase family protein [Winogradskyella forsetii]
MKRLFQTISFGLLLCVVCCNNDDITVEEDAITDPITYNILALGDSYTIGESVCNTCRFPEQLKDSLISKFSEEDTFNLKVIAQTGWTTTNLINAIENESLTNDYDLVTLLIGVNNQYQGKPFSLYETEFPILVSKAIQLAKNDKANVIVVSIPDYAFTPFGQNSGNPETTSSEIDMYNEFAENYCNQENITFVNITDITRQGLINTDLVASDGLHPSKLAYTKFVERLLPVAEIKIE